MRWTAHRTNADQHRVGIAKHVWIVREIEASLDQRDIELVFDLSGPMYATCERFALLAAGLTVAVVAAVRVVPPTISEWASRLSAPRDAGSGGRSSRGLPGHLEVLSGLRESVRSRPVRKGSEMDPSGEARAALRGRRYQIVNALAHVPDAPGLYAIYGSRETWEELQLECESEQRSLYVGKAEDSLVGRDLQTHFATGRTGSSTVRRSFAALLRDSLDLRGQPRNLAKAERFANFGLAQPDDQRLTDWMHSHLRLAVWTKPPGVDLDRIETDVIRAWRPPLNIAKNPHPLAKLKLARKIMADDARAWAESNG